MTETSSPDGTAAPTQTDIRVETEETGAIQRTVRVTVDRKRVAKAFDRTYRELAKSASVRGFRKGKVPRSVLQKLYGASIPDEIERVLIHETLQDAIELAEVLPVVEPEIEAESPREGADFEYALKIEIRPEIELPSLEGLPAQQPKVEVSDEEVDERIEGMREQAAALVEEDEGVEVENGHTITFDYEGRIDGELFEGGAAQGVDLEIGAGRMIPGFEEGLLGARAGDDVTLKVSFPADYGAEHLSGKDAEFACKVHAVRRKQVPELDDEFAKDMGEFETLEELRMSIRSEILKRGQDAAESELHRTVVDSLIERCEFEVPPGVVERQLQSQLDSMRRQFQGQVPDEFIEQQLVRMREDGRPAAERRVRQAYLLDAVGKKLELEVDAEEIDARFREMAEAQGIDVNQLKQMAAQQGWADMIEAELREKRALEFLASKAEVTEPVEEEPESASEDDSE